MYTPEEAVESFCAAHAGLASQAIPASAPSSPLVVVVMVG